MEKSEQRLVIKLFFLKGLSANAIHRKLSPVLASTANYSVKSESGVSASRQVIFHAKTYSEPDVLLMLWERLSPLSSSNFRPRVQHLLRNFLINLNRRSNRFSDRTLGHGDPLEGESRIRCRTLKKPIGEQWQSTF
jgi:hypothetical protein